MLAGSAPGWILRKGVRAALLLVLLGIVVEQITGLSAGDWTDAVTQRPARAASLMPIEGSEFPLLDAVVMSSEDGSGQCQYGLAPPLEHGTRRFAVRVWPVLGRYHTRFLPRDGGDEGGGNIAEYTEPSGNQAYTRLESAFLVDRLMTRLAGVSNSISWTLVDGTTTVTNYGEKCYSANPSPYGTHWFGSCTGKKPYQGTNLDGSEGIIREVSSGHKNSDALGPHQTTDVRFFIQVTLLKGGGWEEIYETGYAGEDQPDVHFYIRSWGAWDPQD